MNTTALEFALHDSPLKGTPRMALLVLALHADHRGRVQIGLRDIGRMCGVSAQIAADAVSMLREQKLIKVLTEGTGTAASVYRVSVPRKDTAQGDEDSPQVQVDQDVIWGDVAAGAGNSDQPASITQNPLPFSEKHTPAAKPESPPPPFEYREFHVSPDGVLQGPSRQIVAIPAWAPQNAVGRVLAAARVQLDHAMPLYWHRREHRDELEQQLSAAKVTLDQLCTALEAAPAQPEAKRIRDLVAAVTKRGKA